MSLIRNGICTCILLLSAFFAEGQWGVNGSNIFYNDGDAGLGTQNPKYRLHAITRNRRIPTIDVSNININLLDELLYHGNDNIHFEIGLTTFPNEEYGIVPDEKEVVEGQIRDGGGSGEGDDNDDNRPKIHIGGLNAFFDKYLLGMSLVGNKRAIVNYGYNYKDKDYKYLRVLAPETNLVDFSLEFKNIDTRSKNESQLWFNEAGDIINARQKSLYIGSANDEDEEGRGNTVRIFAGASKKISEPDIYVRDKAVGIETDYATPGSALDINGVTYARSQVGIQTMPAGGTALDINGVTYARSQVGIQTMPDASAALDINGVTYARSRVGIQTLPNSNAALDVNGNVFVNNKIAINETNLAKIGTHSLAVNGSAIFTKAYVKLNSGSPGWPDYVFENSYDLRSLKDLEAYIKENNHLPEIPSAEAVQKNGIDLGENQALLLKKIEELTLYVIEQHKVQEKLARTMEAQEKIINNQALILKDQQLMLEQLKK